jgi:hypothetical protein
VAGAAEALGPGVALVSTGVGVVTGAGVLAGATGLGVLAEEPHAETTNPRTSASPNRLFHEVLLI